MPSFTRRIAPLVLSALCSAAVPTARAEDAARTSAGGGDAARASATPARGGSSSGTTVTGIASLAGRWIVDLRPSPDDPKYDKVMELIVDADRSVRGSFYDSEIEAGRASASNGRVCFAFRTTDGVGPYHTSGCLVGDHILGQTWAEHRKFVLNWSATRP